MSDDLARTLAAWATRKMGHGGRIPIGPLMWAEGLDDEGVPAIIVLDQRQPRKRTYRIRFTKRGPTVYEYRRNAKGRMAWVKSAS